MKTLTIRPVLTASIVVLSGLATMAACRAQAATDASLSDKHFVSEALKGGMAEIQMGRLAQEKGSSSDVKNFGRKMVQDHTKLGDQMKQVASRLGVSVPQSPTILEQVEIKKLSGLSGSDFDQEYIKDMVKDHEDDLNDFKKDADDGTSPLVKNAATQGANVISGHLDMIKKIAGAHNIALK
jgi:putative membrane protein